MSHFLKPFQPNAMRKRGSSISSNNNIVDENGGFAQKTSKSSVSAYGTQRTRGTGKSMSSSSSSSSSSSNSRRVLGDVSNKSNGYFQSSNNFGEKKTAKSSKTFGSKASSTKYGTGYKSSSGPSKSKKTTTTKKVKKSVANMFNLSEEQQAEMDLQDQEFVDYFSKLDIRDVDLKDEQDPQCVTGYLEEVHDYMRKNEIAYFPKPDYMKDQLDVNEKMRAILVDWLIEVHLKFKLTPETMYLTLNYLDRFLCMKQVVRSKLQLVGVTAMFIASKYEEIYAPECRDMVYITDHAYTRHEVLEMEKVMLATLDFHLTVAGHLNFFNRFARVANFDEETTHMANYFMELAMPYSKMLAYKPSKIAASAVYLAQTVAYPKRSWNNELQYHSRYTEDDLLECVEELRNLVLKAPKSSLKAVHKKYSKSAFGRVATIDFAEVL